MAIRFPAGRPPRPHWRPLARARLLESTRTNVGIPTNCDQWLRAALLSDGTTVPLPIDQCAPRALPASPNTFDLGAGWLAVGWCERLLEGAAAVRGGVFPSPSRWRDVGARRSRRPEAALINEASFDDLLNAHTEGAFTWWQLARAAQRQPSCRTASALVPGPGGRDEAAYADGRLIPSRRRLSVHK